MCWPFCILFPQDLQLCGVEESLVTYSATISACEKAGQWEAALRILGTLDARDLLADVIAMNAAMSACEKSAQWQRALCLMEDLRQSATKVTVVTYNVAISSLGRGGENWRQVLVLLQELQEQQLHPTGITYNAAISACEIGDHWQIALIFLKDMLIVGLQTDLSDIQCTFESVWQGGSVGACDELCR